MNKAFITSCLLETPEILTEIDSNIASQVQKLGYSTTLQTQIDQLIYQLYDLTEEEIKIVEEK